MKQLFFRSDSRESLEQIRVFFHVLLVYYSDSFMLLSSSDSLPPSLHLPPLLCLPPSSVPPFHILSLPPCSSHTLGLVISALVPSVEVALALGPPAIIIALLFGGFYSESPQLPLVSLFSHLFLVS